MTTHNTGNSVPSVDVKDLFDNCETEDVFCNGDENTTVTRVGKTVKTMTGMNADFSTLLLNSGFENVHLTYVVGTALQVNRQTQLIDYNGSVYRVKLPSTFPVNLTGVWATDSPKLVDVGDTSLRQALAAAPTGAAMIGGGIIGVSTYAQLRALNKTSPAQRALLAGLEYDIDVADTTTAESLPNVVVATDGARWKLKLNRPRDVIEWGADNTGVVGSRAAIQAAVDAGGTVTVRDGVYNVESVINIDYRTAPFPEIAYPSKRVSLLGNSMANTIFKINPAGGVDQCFKITGTNLPTVSPGVGQGIHAHDKIGNFTIYPAARNKMGLGIWMTNAAYKNLENYACESLNVGLELDGVLTSNFTNLSLKNGNIGMTMSQTGLSLPNANTFYSSIFGGNSQAGVIANTMGANNKFISSKIEQNGTQGQPGNGGMIVNLYGLNGLACLSLDDCYFEGNAGEADLRIDNIGGFPVTVYIGHCTFNRTESARWTTSNIVVTSSGGGKVKVVLNANGFATLGTYSPSPARPYIQYGSNVEIIGWDTCTYSETTSIAPSFNSSSSAIISGSVDAAGNIINAGEGVVITRLSAGQYNVFHSNGWAPTMDGYNPMVTCMDNLAVQRLDYCKKLDNTTFTVGFRKDAASAYTDVAFSFLVARSK